MGSRSLHWAPGWPYTQEAKLSPPRSTHISLRSQTSAFAAVGSSLVWHPALPEWDEFTSRAFGSRWVSADLLVSWLRKVHPCTRACDPSPFVRDAGWAVRTSQQRGNPHPSRAPVQGELKLRNYEKTSQTPGKSDLPGSTLLPELSLWTTLGPILRNINLIEHPSALCGTPGATGHTLLSAQQPACCYSRGCWSNRPSMTGQIIFYLDLLKRRFKICTCRVLSHLFQWPTWL